MAEYLAYGDITASPSGGSDGYNLTTSSSAWSAASYPPPTTLAASAAVVYNHKMYMPDSNGTVSVYSIPSGSRSAITLTSGSANLVCLWAGIIYILTTGTTPTLYSYDPSSSTLTSLRSTGITGGGTVLQCDGTYVYTSNSTTTLYKTNISSGTATTYSIGTGSTAALLLDPSGTYIYVGKSAGWVQSLTVSTFTLLTNFGFPGGTATQIGGMCFDPSNNLWAVNDDHIQYWTTPSTFTGGSSAATSQTGPFALVSDTSGNVYMGYSVLGSAGILKFTASTLVKSTILNNAATGVFLNTPRVFLCYDNIVATNNGNFFAFMGM